tara:strand:- start:129 stop:662 length:534 start_codon:yes stop_codon:yes gene_type:complete
MKKSLLTESEIRKFMKFANIGTLTENFIENTSATDTLEEEVVEETTQELEEAAHEDDKMEESVIEEETLEEEVEDPAEFVQDLVDVIMKHMDADITVEKSADEPEMDDMGAEPEMDEPMDDEPEMGDEEAAPEMPGDDEPMSGEMAPEDEEEPPMMEDLVNEVTKRVAARLLKENKK